MFNIGMSIIDEGTSELPTHSNNILFSFYL